MNKLYLKSWEECEARKRTGMANPLDLYIYNNEPADKEQAIEFRKELEEVLKWIANEN